MKKNRNNRGNRKYLTLEEAIELINRTVNNTVERIMSEIRAEIKRENEERWKQEEERRRQEEEQRRQEIQAYMKKKDEEIAELRELNKKMDKRIADSIKSSEDAKRGLGFFIEALFENAIPSILEQLDMGDMTNFIRNWKIRDDKGNVTREIDFIIFTDKKALLIMEVQNVVRKGDVEDLKKKLEDIIKNSDKYKDFHEAFIKRCEGVYGIVGGATFHDDAKIMAKEYGIIVAKYSSEEKVIVEKPEKIRDWRNVEGK